jgi:hypothetical protein
MVRRVMGRVNMALSSHVRRCWYMGWVTMVHGINGSSWISWRRNPISIGS